MFDEMKLALIAAGKVFEHYPSNHFHPEMLVFRERAFDGGDGNQYCPAVENQGEYLCVDCGADYDGPNRYHTVADALNKLLAILES
jgi:hypothetical protein